MTTIKKIISKLQKYPNIKYEIDMDTINVLPESEEGFLVWLTETSHDLTVGFEGWHEHFELENEKDALNLFALGLSDDCRLKISYRGSFSHRWTAEMKNDDGWVQIGTTGILFFPFWKKKQEKYCYNKYLKISS